MVTYKIIKQNDTQFVVTKKKKEKRRQCQYTLEFLAFNDIDFDTGGSSY